MKNDSLHNLIIRIGNGDPSAFDTLYLNMREPLCKRIYAGYSPTLSIEDAEDAVQNAFIAIRRYASTYSGKHNEASARKWINTIVSHEASRMVKTKKKLFISLDDFDGPAGDGERGTAVPERHLSQGGRYREGERLVEEGAERAILLNKVLANVQQNLTRDEMEILFMRFVFDYTFEQIGREIGRTKARAKQIVDALIEKIRQSIGVDLTQIDGL